MKVRLANATSTVSAIGWQVGALIFLGIGAAWFVGRAPAFVVLGALMSFIVGLVFLHRPEAGLILLLVVRASTDLAQSYLGNTIGARGGGIGLLMDPNAALILVLILAGGLFILRHGVPVISLPGGSAFVLLLLVGLVGAVRSGRLLFSLSEWIPVVSSLIAFALVAHLFSNPARIRRIVDALALSFILPAGFGLYQLVVGEGSLRPSLGITRIFGTFVHPNPFGLYLVIMLSVFLPQALTQSGRRKWLSFCIVIASSVLLMATFARFAWVGALVVLFTIGALRSPILLIFVPMMAAVIFGALPAVSARLEAPLGGSFAHRLLIWQRLLEQWLQATALSQTPVGVALDRMMGLGPGSWATLLGEGGFRIILPHNDYIRLLVEYGVFGLILYVVLSFVLIRLAFRTWIQSAEPVKALALSFLALTLAYPVMSLVANILANTVNQVYFWSLAGVVVAIGTKSGVQKAQSASHGLNAPARGE